MIGSIATKIGCTAETLDCLRRAQLPETTPEIALKCRAQAISMMRQSQSALRLLLRLQDVRQKREADGAACNRAAWSEHCAIGLMAGALAPAPRPAPIAEPPRPPEQPKPAPVANPEPDPVAEAEHYAALYPERAALIRRMGRAPHNASFGPPDDDLVQALVTARTPALAALDREFAAAPTA